MKDPRFDYMPVAAREYSAQRQMTVGDLLLDNRIIFLDGPIHDGSANLVIMKMLFLQSENRHQDIHLYINSPGGSVTATLAIYDIMQFIECDVATYCVGLSASGGAILVAGGADGVFGAATTRAVRQFQGWNGLQVTGTVTDATAKALGLGTGAATLCGREAVQLTHRQSEGTVDFVAIADRLRVPLNSRCSR